MPPCKTCNSPVRTNIEQAMDQGHSSLCVMWHLCDVGARISASALDTHYARHTNLTRFPAHLRHFPPCVPGWYTPVPVPQTSPEMPLEMVLIRGVPGSSKSRRAWTYAQTHLHCEADYFFVNHQGQLRYDRHLIHDAHAWCEAAADAALHQRVSVVIANTFVANMALTPYFFIARSTGATGRIIEMPDPWPKHITMAVEVTMRKKVRPFILHRMRRQWEAVAIPAACDASTITVEQGEFIGDYVPQIRPFYCRNLGCLSASEA